MRDGRSVSRYSKVESLLRRAGEGYIILATLAASPETLAA
jgi:hypothetical protein